MTERSNTTNAAISVPPGLAGVAVTDTQIGDVRGNEGYYHYRGQDAVELARTRSFEEVWHLLAIGHLPDPREAESFRDRVAALRVLPAPVADVLPAICAATEDPLHVLRTALSLWGSTMRLRPMYDAPEERAARRRARRRRRDTDDPRGGPPSAARAHSRSSRIRGWVSPRTTCAW